MTATFLTAHVGGQVFFWFFAKPRISAFFFKERNNRIERLLCCNHFAALTAGKHRNGNAPRALARNTPIGTFAHHCTNTIFCPRRHPLHIVVDSVKCGFTQIGFVHRHKPLVGSAENNWLVAAPTMRITVCNFKRTSKRSLFFKVGNHVRGNIVSIIATEALTCIFSKLAVIIYRHVHRNIKLASNEVVIYTMTRSGMNNTRTIVKCYMIAINKAAMMLFYDWTLIGKSRKLNAF